MADAELWNFITDVARYVLGAVIVGIGVGMIAVGNRTRKTEQKVAEIDERCHSHGLPYSDYKARVATLEKTVEHRIEIGNRGLQEMRDGQLNLLRRIDTLDTKMHRHVDALERKLLDELRRVNGKVNGKADKG